VFEQLWRHFAQPASWRLYDDAAGTLAELRSRGFQLAIASNFDRRLLEIVHGHPPLAHCEQVFISSDVGYAKPDLRFFRSIEQRLGAVPHEFALVGDDETADVEGATAAGWRAVYVNRCGGVESAAAIRTLAELL